MQQSTLFTKTVKNVPKDEVSKNATLLLRAGFIYKEMAGVYSLLPLGLRVISKIEAIIREEMNALGASEVELACLQTKETWEPTDQWSDKNVDVWFKTKLKNDTELGLAFTHEASMTRMMKEFVSSYRDLPRFVYHFQTKFRNETRARSGIMRTREFLMKDLYSFSKDDAEHEAFYEKAKASYLTIFKRLGIGDSTYLTFADGGVFAKYSHEFQTISEAGEDTVYLNKKNNIAVNKEVYTDEILESLGLEKKDFVEKRAIEVGNIFTLGTRFSDALDLSYTDESGEKKAVVMGSYGIGPARVMATIVELCSDDKGIVWPEAVAPFKVHLLALGTSDEVQSQAKKVYEQLGSAGVDVLFDDRLDVTNGEKFADADLIGCPWRLLISEKTLAKNGLELKARTSEDAEIISFNDIVDKLK